jgi:hypothetical protein
MFNFKVNVSTFGLNDNQNQQTYTLQYDIHTYKFALPELLGSTIIFFIVLIFNNNKYYNYSFIYFYRFSIF